MYEKCKEGLHPLIEIYRHHNGFEYEVVRWCPVCGAIVVDVDLDSRTYAGRCMEMKFPELTKINIIR